MQPKDQASTLVDMTDVQLVAAEAAADCDDKDDWLYEDADNSKASGAIYLSDMNSFKMKITDGKTINMHEI